MNPVHRGERGAKESARSHGKSSPPSRLIYASPYTCSTFQREDAACAASASPFSMALELQQDEDILSSKLELINFHLAMPSPSWSPSQAPCQDQTSYLEPSSSPQAQGGQRPEESRCSRVLGWVDVVQCGLAIIDPSQIRSVAMSTSSSSSSSSEEEEEEEEGSALHMLHGMNPSH